MPKSKIVSTPAVKAVTEAFGGRRKVAAQFLAILFKRGFHIAQNKGRAPRAPKEVA
jgi:hypothetical protein